MDLELEPTEEMCLSLPDDHVSRKIHAKEPNILRQMKGLKIGWGGRSLQKTT